MKAVTIQMVNEFKIKELGMDFMGYRVTDKSPISFHHTIISHKKCLQDGLGHGYWKWNGSILVQDTSHEYLHIIESRDYEIFCRITSEMIEQNLKGKLDIANLKKIKGLLRYFEYEYDGITNSKGKCLIKRDYLENRFNWDK